MRSGGEDVDLERGEMVIRSGKGDKDRRVPFPSAAARAYATQVDRGGELVTMARAIGGQYALQSQHAVLDSEPSQ